MTKIIYFYFRGIFLITIKQYVAVCDLVFLLFFCFNSCVINITFVVSSVQSREWKTMVLVPSLAVQHVELVIGMILLYLLIQPYNGHCDPLTNWYLKKKKTLLLAWYYLIVLYLINNNKKKYIGISFAFLWIILNSSNKHHFACF